MLKFAWKKEAMNFTSHILTSEQDMLEDPHFTSPDLLGQLTAPVSYRERENVMDRIVQAIN